MERQIITVDIAPGNSQVERLGSSQGDIGRPLGVYIIQNGVALDCSAYSAELYILKPDGKFYTTQATVDATVTNLIKWETAEQETPVAGACAAQIRITAGDDDIGTARFVEFVEASPCDMGSASESEVALLTEYVRQARESATSAGRDATTASDAASSASGSASTATTAANTATQAATAATAAADRAEAVEESIPEDYSQLSDDVTGLKSAISESTYNLVTGVMTDTNITSTGRLEYDANLLVFYAPVENGEYYTVLTNESSMICAFYDSVPTPGALSYNQQRIIQPSKTIQAPINGFLACRATTPYNTPQIVLGQEQKDYLPRTTATDFIARTAADEIHVLKTEIDAVSEKIITPELEFYNGISSGYSLFSNTDDEYYSICIVPANTSLTKLSLLAGANTTPTVVLAYMNNNQLTYEWHKNLGTQTAEAFQTYDLNYTTTHECYLFLNKFGFARSSTRTEIPMLATIRNDGTNIVSWSNGSAALDYTAIVYYSNDVSDFDILTNKVADLETDMESVPSVPMMASDIAMFENIGFCGDSYMAGMIVVSENPTVTAQNINLCWGKILERTHGINAFIYAKGGAKASDFITDTDCLPKLLSETAKQLYVISLGHNDAYNRTSVASFKTSYETILDSILEHAPNAKIILCRQSKGYGDMNNGAELNNAISEIGADYNIPVLDPEDDPYLSSAIYVQTQVHNHPVFSGYAGMAEAFNRLFNKATVDYWDYFKGYTGL